MKEICITTAGVLFAGIGIGLFLSYRRCSSIGIIGGTNGPTAIFIAGKFKK